MSKTQQWTLIGICFIALLCLKILFDNKLQMAKNIEFGFINSTAHCEVPILWSYTPYPNTQVRELSAC